MDDVTRQAIGGKACNLRLLQAGGFNVPNWQLVPADMFFQCLEKEQALMLSGGFDIADIQSLTDRLVVTETLSQKVKQIATQLAPANGLFAVRSSAVDEDNAHYSMAGQLDSYLNVTADEVAARVLDVWRSGFSQHLLDYRQQLGVSHIPYPPAVIIQQQLVCEASGVCFTADPLSGQTDIAIISAVAGTSEALLSGEVSGASWWIDKSGNVIDRTDHGSMERPSPLLSDDRLAQIAATARQIAKQFGCPQDVEWALADGILYILQSRAVTATIKPPLQLDKIVWDNSNIAESYAGVTTPLTFSFARYAYEHVYREFCKLLLVSKADIKAEDHTFKHMLGHLQGRIYYNLNSWYKLLALLPGYGANRQYMEQMMGVSQSHGRDTVAVNTKVKRTNPFARLKLLGPLLSLGYHFYKLTSISAAFERRVESALVIPQPLQEMSMGQLLDHYQDLEKQLLKRWDAPLINDFKTMVFSGVLRKLLGKWCGDDAGLYNQLIAGETDIVSLKPTLMMQEMALLVTQDGAMVSLLKTGSVKAILAAMEDKTELQQKYLEYLAVYGDRCISELKLESQNLRQNPEPLFRAIGNLAANDLRAGQQEKLLQAKKLRSQAEMHLKARLKGKPLKTKLLMWLVKGTRACVKSREDLRFQRTRVFGRVRELYLAIADYLVSYQVLHAKEDIFFLHKDEINDYIYASAVTVNLKPMIELRKREYAKYQHLMVLDRVEYAGLIYQDIDGLEDQPAIDDTALVLSGQGCCAGVVKGKVHVVKDPWHTLLEPGEVLVCERTDPGWITLISQASAMVVAKGNLLSHAAIVARELGIPTVVAVTGVTSILNTGDEVVVDGQAGLVTRLKAKDNDVK